MPRIRAVVSENFSPTPLYTRNKTLDEPLKSTKSVSSPRQIDTDLSTAEDIPSRSKKTRGGFFTSKLFKLCIAALVILVLGAAIATPLGIILSNLNATTNSSTTSTILTTLTTATITTITTATTANTSASSSTASTGTTSTSSTTTTTVGPSMLCATSTVPIQFTNYTFLYSPTSQQYAVGMLNNQFGIYIAYGYGNVTSTTIWAASQSSTTNPAYFAGQTDRNLVIYGSNPSSVLWATGTNNGGVGTPFCLEMFDSGNLIWIDNTSTIIWQTNSAQTG